MKKLTQFLIVLMLIGVSQSVFAQAAFDTLSIYDLQFVSDPGTDDLSPFVGDTVVVKGLVMTGPRDLWIGARWSIYIVDPDTPTDPWNGFFVVQDDTSQIQTLLQFVEPGMVCYFTGVISEFSAFSQINIYGVPFQPDPVVPVTIESAGNPLPDPIVLTAADLVNKSVGEQWESQWVKVENAVIVNNNISGNWASINDGTGITYIAEYFNWFHDRLPGAYQWPSNGTEVEVYGFTRDESGSPGQVYTINPRDTLDLVELSSPPVISGAYRTVGVPTPSDNVTVKASIVDNGNVQEARLFYSINDAPYQSLRMNAVADTFAGAIPAQSDGAFVRYFISSVDNVGDRSTLPGDTSRTNGQVYMYTVRQNGLSIRDLQDTHGYRVDVSPYNGYEVTVRGVVMTDSTDFLGDYYIQEAADMWSGIWVNDGTFTHIYGDEVEVTGTIEEDFGITRINNVTNSVVVNAGVGAFEPVVLTTGQMVTGAPDVEPYESVLLRFENVTVTNPFPDAPSNFGEFTIDDGTGGVRVDDRASAFRGNLDSTYALNDNLAFLQGFGYFSFGNTKILPRDTLDVGSSVGIEDDDNHPTAFELEQNFPNPFNPTTSIRYTVNSAGTYKLSVYNVLGQQIRTLVNGFQTPNRYELTWDGRNDKGVAVGSGIYFYKLTGENQNITKKMVLLK
ncbi:MAG: T9SS type A sorting domain-containing protein [Calditrichia bacterium]